jgi:hypothetical protein
MATSRRRASGKKQARRYHAARKLIIKGPELIPTAVLRQLAEMQLPLSKKEYTQRLNELLLIGPIQPSKQDEFSSERCVEPWWAQRVGRETLRRFKPSSGRSQHAPEARFLPARSQAHSLTAVKSPQQER